MPPLVLIHELGPKNTPPPVTRVFSHKEAAEAAHSCAEVLHAVLLRRPPIMRGVADRRNGMLRVQEVRGVWLLSFDLGRALAACDKLRIKAPRVIVADLDPLLAPLTAGGAVRTCLFADMAAMDGVAESLLQAHKDIRRRLLDSEPAKMMCIRYEFAFTDDNHIQSFVVLAGTRYLTKDEAAKMTDAEPLSVKPLLTPTTSGGPVCLACGVMRTGSGAGLFTCNRCKKAHYCSPACQRFHWGASHRLVCKSASACDKVPAPPESSEDAAK